MTTDRCPACGAAVTASAGWCTLCYADLRPHEPEPEPVAVAAAAAVAPPVAPALSLPAPVPAPLPPHPILDAPVAVAAPVARGELATWPCTGCGAKVPMADDVCADCGASFLPSDPGLNLSLPVVGDVGALDKSQRLVVMIGGVFVVMAVFVVVAFLIGSFL